MFRNGKQIGFREHNGNNIDSIMHLGKKVFEQGYDAKASGQNEITLDGTIGKDLKSYEITGDLYQEWTPSPEQACEAKGVGDRTGNLWTSTLTDAASGNTHYIFDKNTQIASIQSNSPVVGFSKSIYKLNTPIPSKTDLTISLFITHGSVTNAEGGSIEIGGYHVGAPNSWQCSIRIPSGSKEGDVITKSIKTTDTLTDLWAFVYSGVVCDFSFKIMLNAGSTSLPYEPYGYKIPVVTKGKNLVSEIVKNEIISATDGSFMPYPKSLRTGYIKAFAGGTYTVSSRYYPFQNYISFYDSDKKYLSRTGGMSINSSRTFQVPSGASYFATNAFYAVSGQINPLDYHDFDMQVEFGDSATPYEPYHPPITTNLYLPTPLAKGEVLRSDGSRDVKWGVVKASDLNWVKLADSSDYTYLTAVIDISYNPDLFVCNKYKVTRNIFTNMDDFSIRGTTTGSSLCIRDSRFPNLEDFIESLKDCYVYYTISNPTTEQIDMPAIPTFKDPDFTPNGQTTVLSIDTEVSPETTKIEYRANKDNDPMLYATQDNKLYATRNGEVYSTWR